MSGYHISLFAGVGMTDIAVEAAGFQTIATAEIDPFCRRVLATRFPSAVHYADVRDVSINCLPVSRPLLISGGFPCQDVSSIGTRQGLQGARSGLWSEFARVIGEFRPEYVLVENVAALRTRGLETVLRDLASLGYDVRWDCIPAAAVGAWHLRDRLFIVGAKSPTPEPFTGPYSPERAGMVHGGQQHPMSPFSTVRQARAKATDAGIRLLPTPRRAPNEWRTTRNAPTHGSTHGATLAGMVNDLERAAGRVPARSSDSAGNINPEWVEWLMGIPIGWTSPDVQASDLSIHSGWAKEPSIPRTVDKPPHRRHRLCALGNGLVPQAAAVALEWIKED